MYHSYNHSGIGMSLKAKAHLERWYIYDKKPLDNEQSKEVCNMFCECLTKTYKLVTILLQLKFCE